MSYVFVIKIFDSSSQSSHIWCYVLCKTFIRWKLVLRDNSLLQEKIKSISSSIFSCYSWCLWRSIVSDISSIRRKLWVTYTFCFSLFIRNEKFGLIKIFSYSFFSWCSFICIWSSHPKCYIISISWTKWLIIKPQMIVTLDSFSIVGKWSLSFWIVKFVTISLIEPPVSICQTSRRFSHIVERIFCCRLWSNLSLYQTTKLPSSRAFLCCKWKRRSRQS